MKILLLGATGAIGSRILQEALRRGHQVTAVARNPQGLTETDNLRVIAADARDTERMEALMREHDAVVASLSPRSPGGKEQYLEAIRSLLTAAERTNVPYIVFVGGAGTLEVEPGKQLLETFRDQAPPALMEEVLTVAQARKFIFASSANWSFACPAGMIYPGERTGRYRTGRIQIVKDEKGNPANISMEDFAVAVLDELEQRRYVRQQWNAGH